MAKKRKKKKGVWKRFTAWLLLPFRDTEPTAPEEEAPEGTPSENADAAKTPHPKKKKRRRHGRSVFWLILTRLVMFLLILVVGLVIWKNRANLTPAAVFSSIEGLFQGEQGDGYPVSVIGDKVIAMEPVGKHLAVLTDSALTLYNTKGGADAAYSHAYAKPLLKTSGNYAVLAEQGGSRIQLIDEKGSKYQIQTAAPIISINLSPDGYVGAVTKGSQGYVSEMAVYDLTGKAVYRWSGADIQAVNVAVRQGGKQAAVTAVAAEGGAMKSSLLVFDLTSGKTDPVASYSGSEVLLLSADYLDSGDIAAVGDVAAWVFDPKAKTCQVYDYQNRQLCGFTAGNKSVALTLTGYGSNSGGTAVMLDDKGAATVETAFTGDYRDVAPIGSRFELLTGTGAYSFTDKGLTLDSNVTDGIMAAELNGNTMLLSLTSLDEVK